ncbi:MAG: ABC transporter ATP-binding protein [Chloroflexi bacterium]|nr:ABC transporter ATP-binding protein [Chloroflexota bacterium]MCL5273888.1 ABC transporter ATP-binding protein [Chloroflexota bacterium]
MNNQREKTAVKNRDGQAASQGDDAPAFAVEVVDVVRTYRVGSNDVLALRGINLQVKPGRWVGVRGRSGSGKTTLLNCIGGLDHPNSGTVRCFGRDITRMSDTDLTRWRRKQVGFVFQSFALLPTLSAWENIELPIRIAGNKDRRARTKYCLELVGLTKWANHRPYEMSGGQQQRVAIARALANHPNLILADEPTGELDSTTAREILALFRRIIETEGITMLMTSHDPIVLDYVDEVVELQDGQRINNGAH